jgi:hypothetical protein
MLRKNTTLLTPLRYFYNNRNNWQRYNKNIPLVTEPVQLQKDFKAGDKPEFIYRNKIVFPKDYKPYEEDIDPVFVLGAVGIVLYLSWRYDRKREINGRTFTSEYSI